MNYSGGGLANAYRIDAGEPHGPPAQVADAFDVRAILAMVWRARWRMALGALIGLLIALAYVSSLKPTYSAYAKVLFAPEERNVVNIEDVLARPANDGLRNQIEILRSTSLLERVVERLDLTTTADFNPALREPDGFWDEVRPYLSWRAYVPWQLLRENGLLPPRRAQVAPTEAQRAAGAALLARRILDASLVLQPVPESRVIAIGITTSDPVLSASVANAVAQEYITAQLDAKLDATREATRWLGVRVEELKDELTEAEAAVSSYRAELAELTGQTPEVVRQQLDALNEGLASASARRSAAEIRHRRAREAIEDTDRIAADAAFQTSDVIASLRAEERKLVADRAALARLVSEDNERLAALDLRIEAVRDDITEEARRFVEALRNDLEIATAEEAEFRTKVRALEEQLQAQSASEVRLRQLQREAEASRMIYENFLGRLKETTQQETLADADAIVLSPAEPSFRPDAGSTMRLAVIGAGFGLMLGFALSLVLERLNNTFVNVEQVEDLTGLTVLGAIPFMGRNKSRAGLMRYVAQKPTSALAEAARSLRTSLTFAQIDDPPQVVMVTSTIPSEGKSTTALLLALTSAQMGKSAIIVDCDLRRPSLSAFLGDDAVHGEGLRGVLAGTSDLAEATHRDAGSGLAVLTSARAEQGPLNAADVLASERFAALLATLRRSYEMVVLDAPPTLSVTDSRIAAQRADATLYCVRWDRTPRELVLEGLRDFLIVKPAIAGIVLTMVDPGKAKRYGHGYAGYLTGYHQRRRDDPYYRN